MPTLIKVMRQNTGRKQCEMARRADLYGSTWSKLESGAEKAGPVVRQRVADALEVHPDELFDKSGWPLVQQEAAV